MAKFSFFLSEQYRSPESVEVAVKLLEHYLKNDSGIITYGDLCKKLSFDINPRNIEKLLGDLSYACKDNGLPPLSALVVNKEDMICGAGFFNAYFPGIKRNDWDEKWMEIYNEIKSYPDWDKVLEIYRAYI